MRMITKAATAAAVASIGMGAAAAGASANFTPAGTSGHAVTAVTSQRFQIDANHYVLCSGVTSSATVNATGTSAAGVPTFSGCNLIAAGTHPATVSTPNTWTFTGNATTGVADTGGTSTVTYGNCVISIPRITNATVAYTNVGANGQVASTATGLPYTSTGCALFGIPASGSTASYTGTISVAGVNAV